MRPMDMLLLMAAMTFSMLEVKPRQTPVSPALAVIRSQQEWSRFAGAPPQVDFGGNTVIAVFAGQRPTAGWSVRVTEVEKTGGACVVRYEVKGPPRGAMTAQVITHPFAVVLVKGTCETATAPQMQGARE